MKHIKIYEQFLNEAQLFVNGKYNTVSKVVKELGKAADEETVAKFIFKNHKDVTGQPFKSADEEADEKIADIIGYYKFDNEEWNDAWDKVTKNK